MPGEISLAHNGVLFLDELPEFRRDALEALRQPLEDGSVTVGRAQRTVTMPARFRLVAAMNPCPCGYLGHPSRPCLCPPPVVQRYRGRLSGPLLDRIDLQVEVPAVDPGAYDGAPDEDGSTAFLAQKVATATARRARRESDLGVAVANADLQDGVLMQACAPTASALSALAHILRRHRASGRARVRLLRVARTLADLRDVDAVDEEDVLEAAALRRF
jgi:magnesium chelatase family protein